MLRMQFPQGMLEEWLVSDCIHSLIPDFEKLREDQDQEQEQDQGGRASASKPQAQTHKRTDVKK